MHQGLFPTLRAKLWGPQVNRLSERNGAAHFLSYLLVGVQSITVVFVFGHTLLTLMATGSWYVRGVAGLAAGALVATVWAADIAVLRCIKRIPALLRNRQSGAVFEHVAYVLFVLITEGSTYAVVINVLERNASALFSPAPIIPDTSWIFGLAIFMRVVMLGWTAVQLPIVASALPPQLNTLMSTGKEIVGAHIEASLVNLDMSAVPLPAAFRVFEGMSRPPRRMRTWLNGPLFRRDEHRENEEARQAKAVLDALRELDAANDGPQWGMPLPAPRTPDDPFPTGPGTPATRGGNTAVYDTSGVPAVLSGPDARVWLPDLSELRNQSGAAADEQQGSGNDAERAVRLAAKTAEAMVYLRVNPSLNKEELRAKLRIRQEDANGIFDACKLAMAKEAREARQSAQVAQ